MIAKTPEMLNLPTFFSEAANGGGGCLSATFVTGLCNTTRALAPGVGSRKKTKPRSFFPRGYTLGYSWRAGIVSTGLLKVRNFKKRQLDADANLVFSSLTLRTYDKTLDTLRGVSASRVNNMEGQPHERPETR